MSGSPVFAKFDPPNAEFIGSWSEYACDLVGLSDCAAFFRLKSSNNHVLPSPIQRSPPFARMFRPIGDGHALGIDQFRIELRGP